MGPFGINGGLPMFFWVWTLLAFATAGFVAAPDAPPNPRMITTTTAPARPAAPPSPAEPAAPASPASPAYVAEPQVPSGRFTTAVEVKPILTATKNVWVAVREYDGKDLVYVTQILSWRCGLVGMSLSINGGTPEIWDLPPCHEDTAAPNAIMPEDGLPYRAYPLGSVQTVTIGLTYDDLTTDAATYQRSQILMP